MNNVEQLPLPIPLQSESGPLQSESGPLQSESGPLPQAIKLGDTVATPLGTGRVLAFADPDEERWHGRLVSTHRVDERLPGAPICQSGYFAADDGQIPAEVLVCVRNVQHCWAWFRFRSVASGIAEVDEPGA